MKIIDFHVHAGAYYLLRDDIQDLLNRRPQDSGDSVAELFSNPKALAAYLSANGVHLGMVLAECGPGTNYTITSAMIAAFCAGNPMMVPFGSINPNVQDPIREFEDSVARGVRGFKFYPADHGFMGTHPGMMEVYRRCAAAHMPMVFHTGSTAQRDAQATFVRPTEFLPIIDDNPDGLIILAHAGRPYYDEAFDLAAKRGNVWLDTGLTSIDAMRDAMEDETLGRRILFGSDWPVSGSYSRLIRSFMEAGLSEAALERVFWSNAVDVLARAGIAVPEDDTLTEAPPLLQEA